MQEQLKDVWSRHEDQADAGSKIDANGILVRSTVDEDETKATGRKLKLVRIGSRLFMKIEGKGREKY